GGRCRLGLVTSAVLVVILSCFSSVIALQRRQRLDRAQRDLTTNLSHELKTPLAVLRVCAETLSMGRARDEEHLVHYCGVIGRETERLGSVVDQLLACSRDGTLPAEAISATIDLRDVVNHVLDHWAARLRQANFEVERDVPERPSCVRGQASLITQALENLVDNALKYARDGGWIRIEVACEPSSSPPEWRLEVHDRGPGISRRDQRAVFERFHRLGDPLTHKERGSGLGLTIAREIVEGHAGSLELAPSPVGCVFVIKLPAEAESGD
ncbi:MAG: HAMP domain-containing sensor histidine kinase, partial [Planctomycetota bacterium]